MNAILTIGALMIVILLIAIIYDGKSQKDN